VKLENPVAMSRHVVVTLYVVAMAVFIASVDFLFFKDRFGHSFDVAELAAF
jgi:hypothetical protein